MITEPPGVVILDTVVARRFLPDNFPDFRQRRGTVQTCGNKDRDLRTIDSGVRAREVFGLRRCAIVSDGWHVPRALFIANKFGLDAVGIAARPVPVENSFKARAREWGARVDLPIEKPESQESEVRSQQ